MDCSDILRAGLASLFTLAAIVWLIMGTTETPPGSWRRHAIVGGSYVMIFMAVLLVMRLV